MVSLLSTRKTFSSHFLSPRSPNACFSHLLFTFISFFFSPRFFFPSFFLHLPFVHLLFLDLIFLFHIFSLSRFVIHLFCHWSHLSVLPLAFNNYLTFCAPFDFLSLLSCRVCFIFCVNASLFLTSCFSSFVLLFFSPPFIFFFLTVFLHLSFISLLGLFLVVFFFLFFLVCIFLSCTHFTPFSEKSLFHACFVFDIFPSVSISFHKKSRVFCLILFVFQHFFKTNPFSLDI